MDDAAKDDCRHTRPWRTGTKNGRIIYVLMGTGNKLDDVMIGAMDTPALAAHVVAYHNAHYIHED